MNFRFIYLLLAMIFSAAVPALADGIPKDPQNGETVSHYSQQWTHSDPLAIGFSAEDMKSAKVLELSESRLTARRTQEDMFALTPFEGYAFGRDHDQAWDRRWDKRHDHGDGPISSIAVPEPNSQLLLLFGLASLGMLFYRRTSLKQAI